MADSGQPVDRRTVLRTIATSGVLAAGAGLTSAKSESQSPALPLVQAAERQFGDVASVEQLFGAYGEPVVAALVDAGYLTADATLSIESVVSRPEFSSTEASGVAAIGRGRRQGEDVVDVRIRQQTAEYEIEYHLNPGFENGYAFVTPADGDKRVTVFADGTENVTTDDFCCPEACSDCGQYDCPNNDICDCISQTWYYYEERLCCAEDSDGSCVCSWQTGDCTCAGEYTEFCPQ